MWIIRYIDNSNLAGSRCKAPSMQEKTLSEPMAHTHGRSATDDGAKQMTRKQYPWLCARGRDSRVKKKYLTQAGPPFRTRRYAATVAEAVFKCKRCGEYCVLPVYQVKAGRQQTCGCLRLIAKREHPVLVDTRSIVRTAHLTQVGAQFRVHGDVTHAVFQCTCKTRKILRVPNVTRGTTISCGCTLSNTATMRLLVELQYFEQLRKCCIPVDLDCMNRATIAEQCESLHSVLGYRKQGQMIGLRDNAIGWVNGNIEWQSRRTAMANRQLRIMSRQLRIMSRLKSELDATSKLEHCGKCDSEYHKLRRINSRKGRTVDNMQWLLPSAAFIELVRMEEQMIERASRVRRNQIANAACPLCFSKRTRIVSNKSKRGHRQHKCHDCGKSFRVPISDHATESHQITVLKSGENP